MPLIIWGGVALAGVYGIGWAAKEGGEAMDSTANALKWAAIAGGVYVAYSAAKSAGVIK
ncbi:MULTISPECIES: hypothetical protein [Pseudomonadota]|uniref:hypothetical protein n=1 Tax=Pseudomonadota TaxID=1224 RepID=UPI00131F35C7|nr:hypothetical protein [Celeribacter baekdonensis]